MKRLFWIAVGVSAAVVATKKWQQVVQREDAVGSVARISEAATVQVGRQVAHAGGALWDRFSGRLGDFVTDFKTNAQARETELRESLLAESQLDVNAVRDRRSSGKHTNDADRDAFAGDEELLGYEF